MVEVVVSTRKDVLIDVTDLVEFCQRAESVSGVQRVVAEVAPLLIEASGARCVFLDRPRGLFIELNSEEQHKLVETGVRSKSSADRSVLAATADSAMARGQTAQPVPLGKDSVLVFLGALWINDALMMAAREAHSQGARLVSLLYDLTPVMEAGHTAAVNQLFERYLGLLLDCASRAPAISRFSRSDFETYAQERGRSAPAGAATQLPCGLAPGAGLSAESPWPRPYALFVGTVEARKNHILALHAWEELIAKHGPDNIPDLVCVGRLGWHAGEFLRTYVFSKGLNGKVSVLSGSLADGDLANLYGHAEFTVYPSRYEGWGLPVSESLAFGKLPVVADNSSLREAGGDLAAYFISDDVESFIEVVERNALDTDRRRELEARIHTRSDIGVTWENIADVLAEEIDMSEWRPPMSAKLDLGKEYMLSVALQTPDEGYADQYLDFLTREGLTPMLGQPRGERDFEAVDATVVGTFGSPQAWGYEIRPGSYAQFRFTRPVDGDLVVLISTRSMPGCVTIESAGPGGPLVEDVYLGSVITLPVGEGQSGDSALVRMTVTDAHDSVEGFLGIRSFVVLRRDDVHTQTIALNAAASALRQELDFLQGTRSWKVTAPLRKWKGRGA